MTPQQQKNVDLWIEALQSDNYDQNHGELRSEEGGFCCLGVLATEQGVEYGESPSGLRGFVFPDYGRERMVPPPKWFAEVTGFPESMVRVLTQANDGHDETHDMRQSFEQIARWLHLMKMMYGGKEEQ